MRFFYFFYFGCLTNMINSLKFHNNDTRINGENGWYVPLTNGSWKWVSEKEIFELKHSRGTNDNWLNPVTFLLYTKSNTDQPQNITASFTSIENSNFNRNHRTIFVIHGWFQNRDTNMNKMLRQAFLNAGAYNFIYLEWLSALTDYITSALSVPRVGLQMAELIDFLVNKFNVTLNNVDIVGFSLGAQIAGYAGKNTKFGKIHSIVALDPARPLFSYNQPDQRLNTTDAFYVESIQTSGQLGYKEPIGTAAFYPNGGRSQPNCGLDIIGECSHTRAIEYFAEAIVESNFGSIKCQSYKKALAKDCGNELSLKVLMGAAGNAFNARGSYYVPVKKKSPYGILNKE